jgi:aryl-alcohol dehydrogenase-like predicted oxidoreductase
MFKKISIGTANFGFQYGHFNDLKIKKKNIFKILEYAETCGIKYLDTAIDYGESQKLIGEYGSKNFLISSKLPRYYKNSMAIDLFVNSHIEKSLNDLKINKIDTFFLHYPKDLDKDYGYRILESINKAKKEKKINKIGFSIYQKNELLSLVKFKPDIFQVPMNVFNQDFLDLNLVNFLKRKKIKIEARSIFLQGLLTLDKIKFIKKNIKFKQILTKWDYWIKRKKISKLEACIKFINQINFLDKFIIGINNKIQLEEILIVNNQDKIYFPQYLKCSKKEIIDPRYW